MSVSLFGDAGDVLGLSGHCQLIIRCTGQAGFLALGLTRRFSFLQWLVCCARLTPSRLVFVSRAHTPKAGKIRARVLSRTRSALTELYQPHFDGSPLRTAAMLPLVFEARRRQKSCNRTLCETRCSGFAFTAVRQAHVGPRAAGCVSACANRWR